MNSLSEGCYWLLRANLVNLVRCKSSMVLRRPSCDRRANLTCDSASHCANVRPVGRRSISTNRRSTYLPIIRFSSVDRRIFFVIASFRFSRLDRWILVCFLHLFIYFYLCFLGFVFLDKPRFKTKVYEGAQEYKHETKEEEKEEHENKETKERKAKEKRRRTMQ